MPVYTVLATAEHCGTEGKCCFDFSTAVEAASRSALMSIHEKCHIPALLCHALINFVICEANDEANPIVLEHFLVLKLYTQCIYASDVNSGIACRIASVNASDAKLTCQHVGPKEWFLCSALF